MWVGVGCVTGQERTPEIAVEHVDLHIMSDFLAVLGLFEPAAEIGGPRAQARDANCAVVAEQFAQRVAVRVHLLVVV